MSFVRVEHVAKFYRQLDQKIVALADVSFALDLGESLAILGGSGAGKSTLLNLLGGLDNADSGRVIVGGQDLAQLNDEQKARFRGEVLGFVFQFHNLLKDFSVLENVMMPLRIRGESTKKIKPRALELLQRVGLSGKEQRLPRELSGGEQQRVALVRGVIHSPKLILADEPTGNLDTENAESVFALLCELNRDLNATLIVVTHNLDLARLMKARIVLEKGKRVS